MSSTEQSEVQIVAERNGIDLWLLAATLALAGLGLTMVYSASAVASFSRYGSDLYIAKRQAIYFLFGLVALYLGARTDYRIYLRAYYPLLLVSLALLALVMLPGVGSKVGGARRWLRFASLSFQPSELAKLALVIYLASSLARKAERIRSFSVGFLPHMLVCAFLVGLLLLQPDLGTSMLLMGTMLAMLFVAGGNLTYILLALLATAPVAWYAVVGTSWRLHRLLAFFQPEAHRSGAGYQVYESLVTLGSGGWTGVGLGEGRQKLFFLPEGHTDFILPVIGQELGFMGVVAVVALMAFLVFRAVRAALRSYDLFGTQLAFGIGALLAMQALTNMGVVVGVLPTKGLTLPLVSAGGTSLVITLWSIGILLNISRSKPPSAAVMGWADGRAIGFRELASFKRWAFSAKPHLPFGGGSWDAKKAGSNRRVR